jgi:hypothetical protein
MGIGERMPRPRKNPDLLATLVDRLADAVAAHLGGKPDGTARMKRKPTFSRAGIERIRAAQRKRWAAYRKAKAAPGR